MLKASKLIINKIIYRLFPPKEERLLEMIWLEAKQSKSFLLDLDFEDKYRLRQFVLTDREKYFKLLEVTEMGACPLDYWFQYILPNGFFVVEHIKSGDLVGACFASHQSKLRHPFAGNLGWLAVDPSHRGNKIGIVLVDAVLRRLLHSGYERIYLETHDFRLAAIKIYLQMGWLPFLYTHEMNQRWEVIYSQLGYNYNPSIYPKDCLPEITN